MKKLFTLFSLALLSIAAVNAQEQVKNNVVSSNYNRPSVAYIMVDREGTYAKDIENFFTDMEIGEKYDENKMETYWIDVNHTADVATTAGNVGAVINKENLGAEVISYIFNRQEDGSCDDSNILKRGLYNAKDQDIQNLEGAKVKEQAFEWGEPLVNNSYVVALDVYSTKVTKSEDGKSTYYTVKCAAHAFKLEADKETLNNFYMTGWADATSSDEEKAAAVAAFNNLKFNLKHVTSVDVIGTSTDSEYTNGNIYKSCFNAYESVVFNLEKQIDAWKTVVSVISTRPIAAKIGTKESLKNGDRFQAYSYKEDKNGELKSVKHGMVRATVIANNSGIATGDTKPSYFYQISGALNVKEGYILQQKNDLKLGVAGTLGIASAGFRLGLDMDYIAHISKHGFITYGMINVGTNLGTHGNLTDAMIGGGFGIPLTRFAEITPYALVGGYALPGEGGETESDSDGSSLYYNSYDDDAEMSSESESESELIAAYSVEGGVRAALTFQPLSIFLTAGIQINTPVLVQLPLVSPVVKFGVKWTF